MNLSRRKILVLLIGAAAIVAFLLTYRKSNDLEPQGARVPDISLKDDVINGPTNDSTGEPATPYYSKEAAQHLALTAENIAWFTNYYRAEKGIAPLKQVTQLNNSATEKSHDMFSYQYFDHERPDSNVSFDTFIDHSGYEFLKAGENLARGNFSTARDVVDAWMASEGHRRNILDPGYRNIGVAIERGSFEGIATIMFVQHFAVPKTNCPSVNNSLKRDIDDLKGELDTKESEIKLFQKDLENTSSFDPSYNKKIETYNSLVTTYNALAQELQGMVTEYNGQVAQFEACLDKVL